MSIKWRVEEQAGKPRTVFVSGRITEEAEFQPIVALAKGGSLRLDLAEIEQINSCGVREWIHFVNHVDRSGVSFELVRCSPAIVRQLNMISNFRGNGQVRSVMLPYYCAACGHEETRILEIAPGAKPDIEEVITCPECRGDAEFDDLPSSYVAFLS